MPTTKRVYGWVPDLPDHRDYKFTAAIAHKDLPNYVTWRRWGPRVFDQEDLGSCTANAVAGAYEYEQIHQKEDHVFRPSRLFIYYNARVFDGSNTAEDTGASIRSGVKSVIKLGVCNEYWWPYDVSKFDVKPSAQCYDMASKFLALRYQRVHRHLDDMQSCLAEGQPFVFGFTVFESFEGDNVARTGVMPMPGQRDAMLGGHAVMAVGYDNYKKVFIVRNSWGGDWGYHGHFFMPYDFMLNPDFTDDFWTIKKVADPDLVK